MNTNNSIIVFASDHNGVDQKNFLVHSLRAQGISAIDLGPYSSISSVDYIDYAFQAATIVSAGHAGKAVLLCGTGVGMSIVANRVKDVRAVLAHNKETSVKSRDHNDSNIICLGSWINSNDDQLEILRLWLDADWGAGRHIKRVSRIDKKEGIVLTNGVFDLLHKGHLELLKFAKTQGTKLVVAIDSDERVKALKGPNRPINSQDDRKRLLESNRFVDEVVIFNSEQELKNLYHQILPTRIVKGGEWTHEEIRVRDGIPDEIEIKIFPLADGYSTTSTLTKISGDDKWQKKDC